MHSRYIIHVICGPKCKNAYILEPLHWGFSGTICAMHSNLNIHNENFTQMGRNELATWVILLLTLISFYNSVLLWVINTDGPDHYWTWLKTTFWLPLIKTWQLLFSSFAEYVLERIAWNCWEAKGKKQHCKTTLVNFLPLI